MNKNKVILCLLTTLFVISLFSLQENNAVSLRKSHRICFNYPTAIGYEYFTKDLKFPNINTLISFKISPEDCCTKKAIPYCKCAQRRASPWPGAQNIPGNPGTNVYADDVPNACESGWATMKCEDRCAAHV